MAEQRNVFIQNSDKIREIAIDNHVTVSDAARIFMVNERLTETMDSRQTFEDLNQWDALCQSYMTRPDVTLRNMWDDIKEGKVTI